ncbi:mannose-1-phosphate guanylyltransferase [Botryobacter ruber]|uniref:mannose-1-phosphate guanylyltransferase n=1 Tax=Botryobacter ruber TaxID=2171629 RepID=UPI000E0BC4BB|nr:mannose-1-phosphate guanylyltransferase [Botryobacter ruber]
MDKNTFVVIMAGGIGSRFWPFSRTNFPKQFHDVLGIGETMLQMTVKRFRDVCLPENIFVVTNKDYEALVKEQLPELGSNQVLLEPVGRNTAPCIAYASYKIAQLNPNANLIVAPSDHVVLKEEAFTNVLQQALSAARKEDVLITLGITPSRPDTGYGYIQYIENGTETIKKVKTFTEKPNLEIAQMFLESGDFVWNSGIFIWSAKSILKAFREHLPDMNEIFEEGSNIYNTPEEQNFITRAYSQCRNVSIDYGIMEKVNNVYVVLSDIGWSDLGTWNSLYTISDKDKDGNVVDGDVMLYDTKNCIIKTPKERLVVLQGLEGFIVAEYDNVLMVCRINEEQKVKEFTSDAKNKKGANYI